MIGRIIEIIDEDKVLSLNYGRLIISNRNSVVGRVDLDEVLAILVNPRGTLLSASLMSSCAERNIPVIVLGNNYAPVSITVPIEGNFEQSARIRAQIEAKLPLKKRIWQQIVKSKLEMQAAAIFCAGESPATLLNYSKSVLSGDSTNREAAGAKYYWPRFFGASFKRDRELVGVNSFLNYGYAVLRSTMARAVVAAGLHPGIGVQHRNAYNSMCLVDDLLEPFRPFVDLRVLALSSAGYTEVTTEVKRSLVSVINTDIPSVLGNTPVSVSMQYLATSLAQIYRGTATILSLPDTDSVNYFIDSFYLSTGHE